MTVRLPFLIPGVILVILGVLWTLQGSGVVNQGAMANQRIWVVIGAVVAIAGFALGYMGLRPRAQQG